MSEFLDTFQSAFNNNDLGELHGVIYVLGNSLFYLPLSEVEDVFTPLAPKKVPGSVDYFAGITIFDQKPVCLISTHDILQIPKPLAVEALQVKTKDKTKLAFEIDRVYAVVDKSQLERVPSQADSTNERISMSLRAKYQYEGIQVTEIDLMKLI